MSGISSPVVAAGAALLLLASATHAADATSSVRHHAIGLDMVRLLDHAQFEPNDGSLNFFYQGYLTKNSAWTAGYAWGDKSSIPEVTYKIYNQGYQEGTFWQIGAASVDVDGTSNNGDGALLGAFGFERSPTNQLVVSGAVKALVGIDHPNPSASKNDIIFLPSLSVLFTF